MSIKTFLEARLTRLVARLGRDRRGAALIEFAFVAGPLIALIMAALQTSLVFFAQQNLETTAEKSVRQLLTGAAQSSSMTKAQFKSLACSKLPAFMDCANLIVDVQVASNFSSANTGVPTLTYDASGNITNNWTYQPGVPGQITVARIMYVWNVSKGPLGFDLTTMSTGKRLLISTSVFKTEPYGS
ncbi:TadE/TadG family type IV pilus assembly protein [Sphingomonas sp.]|uniref:TadE/TadG family type IV pilus assembly protein n=1 Tax=Sphingomonas sp. TaxID=28214 RepID=UPI0035BBAA1B